MVISPSRNPLPFDKLRGEGIYREMLNYLPERSESTF